MINRLAQDIDPNLKGSLLLLKDQLEIRIKAMSERLDEVHREKRDIENALSSLRQEFGRLHDLLEEFSKGGSPKNGENYLYKTNLQDQNRPSCEFDQD